MTPKNIENLANELASAISHLLRKMRKVTPEDSEFTWTQKTTLIRLEHEGPMTISDLARAEGMKSQSMGAVIAELEKLGAVERKPHPSDGRQFNIQLTAKGARDRKTNRALRRSVLTESLAKLPSAEQELLAKSVDVLKKLVDL